jgi:kynurenine formamidase
MCAPSIIESVRTELSRRAFVGLMGGGAVAIAGASSACRTAEAPAAPVESRAAVRLSNGFRQVVDLTHVLSPRMPVFPAFRSMQFVERFTIEKDGFQCGELTLNEHCGTHMDAPIHFVAGGETVDRIAAERLIAPLVVISIRSRVGANPDTGVTVDDLQAWEKSYGRIPPGALVVMDSGWDQRIGDAAAFINTDQTGRAHTPGFTGEAAAFLVKERDIVGVGVDTLSLDMGVSTSPAAHLAVLGAGKYGLEVIANLANVPPAGATAVVGGPKHQAGTGGPVRLLALV